MAAQEGSEFEQKGAFVDNVNRAAEIFYENGDFIRSIIRCKVCDENLVDDLFQDFFLSLTARPIPQDVRNMRSFIYKAIINDITDRARSVERYRNLMHKYADFFNEVINKQTVENALEEREQAEKMIELIKRRVTKSEENAIRLRCNEDLDIGEIADRMGVNKRSVSRYISTGLRKVRQFLTFGQGD